MMSIKITDKTENITIAFIQFNDAFGRVTVMRGWQLNNNQGSK